MLERELQSRRDRAVPLRVVTTTYLGSTERHVARVKPVLDGIISALHVHGRPLDDELRRRLLANGLGGAVTGPGNLLDPAWGVLDTRQVVRTGSSRDGLVWNRADDHYASAELLWGEPVPGDRWRLDVEVRPAVPSDAT